MFCAARFLNKYSYERWEKKKQNTDKTSKCDWDFKVEYLTTIVKCGKILYATKILPKYLTLYLHNN